MHDIRIPSHATRLRTNGGSRREIDGSIDRDRTPFAPNISVADPDGRPQSRRHDQPTLHQYGVIKIQTPATRLSRVSSRLVLLRQVRLRHFDFPFPFLVLYYRKLSRRLENEILSISSRSTLETKPENPDTIFLLFSFYYHVKRGTLWFRDGRSRSARIGGLKQQRGTGPAGLRRTHAYASRCVT